MGLSLEEPSHVDGRADEEGKAGMTENARKVEELVHCTDQADQADRPRLDAR